MNQAVRQFESKAPISNKRKILALVILVFLVLLSFFFSLFLGFSKIPFSEAVLALFGIGESTSIRIMQNIRLPRLLAALLAGGGLAISGLIMQTTLKNVMASPSTLGVSDAAVFGANLAMIALAGGFIDTGNNASYLFTPSNPYLISFFAFLFATGSVFLVLALGRIKGFSPDAVVLAGIAIGVLFRAGTTLLEIYTTDVGLSAMVMWSFGDLSRATYSTVILMAAVVLCGYLFFQVLSFHYNALLAGEEYAISLGVKVKLLRFVSLFVASLITAVCVSFLGIIGFLGILAPHTMKRIVGQDHVFLLPSSLLFGSFLLIVFDTLARVLGNGETLPVGALTALIGAPFFLVLLFSSKEVRP